MILKTDMLIHQEQAHDKLKRIKIGALYAEQGTGKTRMALEIIKDKYNAWKINHILWLCPCNAIKNIEKELIKHVGKTDNFTVHGIETLSSSIRANVKLRKLVQEYNVYLIVDESNLVKNPKAKRTQNIQVLADKCTYKMILNGTPISRDESDLFSQWFILDWRVLGYRSFWSFAANHIEYDKEIPNKINRTLNTDYLTRKIAPYSYQIKKSECMDLPKKADYTYVYDMPHKQFEEYGYVANKLLFEVDELKPHTIYRLFAGLQNVIAGNHVWFDEKDNMCKKPMFQDPIKNPRIETLLDVTYQYEGKMIIFCKYRQEIQDVVSVLKKEYGLNSALPFDGSVSRKQRIKNLDNFENDVRFLVANKVTAGYSLNLQFCHNILFYNNDWDFATRSQAEDRVHRYGQNKQVNIIDILANNTLDERIIDNLRRKESLVDEFKKYISEMKDKNIATMRGWLDGKEKADKHHIR